MSRHRHLMSRHGGWCKTVTKIQRPWCSDMTIWCCDMKDIIENLARYVSQHDSLLPRYDNNDRLACFVAMLQPGPDLVNRGLRQTFTRGFTKKIIKCVWKIYLIFLIFFVIKSFIIFFYSRYSSNSFSIDNITKPFNHGWSQINF